MRPVPDAEGEETSDARDTPADGRIEAARVADDVLFRRYRTVGDEVARDELVRRHLPMARRLCSRYRHHSAEMQDLEQVASLALVKAIDRFEPGRGAFSSYAVPTILGELKRYFRDNTWSVRVPRELKERTAKVLAATERLQTTLGRSITVQDIAEHTGLTVEEALEAMEAFDAYEAASLDAPARTGEGDAAGSLLDVIGADDPELELVEYGAEFSRVIKRMSDRDRLILNLRFVEDLTQSEIGERIGVSQMQVSRLLRRAVEKLRAAVDEDVGPDD